MYCIHCPLPVPVTPVGFRVLAGLPCWRLKPGPKIFSALFFTLTVDVLVTIALERAVGIEKL